MNITAVHNLYASNVAFSLGIASATAKVDAAGNLSCDISGSAYYDCVGQRTPLSAGVGDVVITATFDNAAKTATATDSSGVWSIGTALNGVASVFGNPKGINVKMTVGGTVVDTYVVPIVNDGANAELYDLAVSPSSVRCSSSGIVLNAVKTVTSTVIHRLGKTAVPVKSSDALYITIKYCTSSSDTDTEVVSRIALTTDSYSYVLPDTIDTSVVSYRVILEQKIGEAYAAIRTSDITVSFDGAKGAAGSILRGPQYWDDLPDGYPFQAGGENDTYKDVVIKDAQYYECKTTHAKSSELVPSGTNSDYWTLATKLSLVATDLLLSEEAIIRNLIASVIKTGSLGTPHVEAKGAEFKIYGYEAFPFMEMAWRENVGSVLRFYDEKTGQALYDLGPGGILDNIDIVPDKWTIMPLKSLTTSSRLSAILDVTENDCTKYNQFVEGYKQLSGSKQYNISGTSSPSSYSGKMYVQQSYNSAVIPDGWYVGVNNGNYLVSGTESMDSSSTPLYMCNLLLVSGGKVTNSAVCYFTEADTRPLTASKSLGRDKDGNLLGTNYPYLWSYGVGVPTQE